MITEADSQIKQIQLKMKHNTKELTSKQKELKTNEREYKKIEKKLANCITKKDQLETTLNKMNYNEIKYQQLQEKLSLQHKKVDKIRYKYDELSSLLTRFNFHYQTPRDKSFKANKIKGLIAKLITIKDLKYSKALEVTAGGRLYNLVVDDEQTGKLLLEQGQLQKRITIIPLNKIAKRHLKQEIISQAKSLVNDANDVDVALSLVGYKAEVEAAIKYVFGTTLIVKDNTIAELVTFNPKVRTRSVTLQGDIYDPAGTLTGGSSKKDANISMLQQLQQLLSIESSLKEKKRLFYNSYKMK